MPKSKRHKKRRKKIGARTPHIRGYYYILPNVQQHIDLLEDESVDLEQRQKIKEHYYEDGKLKPQFYRRVETRIKNK